VSGAFRRGKWPRQILTKKAEPKPSQRLLFCLMKTLHHLVADKLKDIFPTILEGAGIPSINGKPGENLLGPSLRKAGFCEFNDQAAHVSFMWRTRERKLILTFPKENLRNGELKLGDATAGEFYDLKTDAREWTNLYGRAEWRADRERMRVELLAHLNGVALKKANRSK